MTYFTSAKVHDFRRVNRICPRRRSKKRLTNFSFDYCKIRATVKILAVVFKDHESILNAWNSLPSLFYFRGKIDRLIDAKYLAAIRKLNFLQKESEQMSECELYYTWLFFQGQYGQFNTSLISLSSFYEFQESWRILNTTFNDLICTDKYTISESCDDFEQLKVEDSNQLNIHFY